MGSDTNKSPAGNVLTFKGGDSFRIHRIYTGDDGKSHWEDIDLPVSRTGVITHCLKAAASRVMLNMCTSDWYGDWHPAPGRVLAVILQGEMEVDLDDGLGKHRIRQGEILLAEDQTGKGHTSKCASDSCMWVQVFLDEDLAGTLLR